MSSDVKTTQSLVICYLAILMTSPSFRQVLLVVLLVLAVLVNICVPLDVWLEAWSWSSATVASFLVAESKSAKNLFGLRFCPLSKKT